MRLPSLVIATTAALVAACLPVRAADTQPADLAQTDLARTDLAPVGTLRAAINYGNPVLAQSMPAAGAPHGVSADLARELGRRLGVPVRFVIFHEAGAVTAAASSHNPSKAWDIAFLAIDPIRAADSAFTPPYVQIEGTYLVGPGASRGSVAEMDAPGVRIAVARGSAYDLYLTRALRHAELVRSPDSAAAVAAFESGHLDALAGVRQPLEALAATHPGWRVLDGRFMQIDQAMALPAGHPAGLAYLRGFIAEMKASGFVARALQVSGQSGAAVAP